MVRSTALVLRPAAEAWGALVDIAQRAPTLPEAASALEIARSAVPLSTTTSTPRRRRRVSVPAGRVIEVLSGPRRGSPLLEPAPGALPGVDEARQGLAVYRVFAAGQIEGACVAEGARVVVSRRQAARGEWVAIVDTRSIRLCVNGAAGLAGVPAHARILGTVEAVVGEGQRRRCA